MGLGKILEESCRLFAQKTALIYNDIKLTYDELNRAASSLGNGLLDLGVKKGDNVAIMLPNIPEFVISYFAVQKIGGVAVTLNIMSTPYELNYLLKNSDSVVLITTTQLAQKFQDIRKDLPLCREILATGGFDEPSPFMEMVQAGPFELKAPDMGPDDPAAMIYTSGLKEKPLGAVLTQKNLSTQALLLRDICEGTEDDRALCVIPLFHAFGAATNMLSPLRIGASTVLMDQFLMDSIFKTIEKEKVTYISSVPRLFLGMFFHEGADNFDTSSLRLCITGGAAMPPDLIPHFEKKFQVKILEGYGLTEASPVCSFSRINLPQKPGSIGTPIPNVELKVFNDEGREVPRGSIGELVVRGENVMKGYYKDEQATSSVIRDGWLHTGDLALIDDDGYVFLKGLKKRLIITSGFNVYPREVETVLEMYPGVKSSRVVGKPDLMRGEIVKALVLMNDGQTIDEKALLKHCRTYLSSYKVPRRIEFVSSLADVGC